MKKKKVVRLSLKAPAAAKKGFSTNTVGNNNNREPPHKHAAGEKCLSSKADCKGVSSGSYRCIFSKARYKLKINFFKLIKNLKIFLIFDIFLRQCLTCWVNSIPCESCSNKSSNQEEGEDALNTTQESILSMLTPSEDEKANIDAIEKHLGTILYLIQNA